MGLGVCICCCVHGMTVTQIWKRAWQTLIPSHRSIGANMNMTFYHVILHELFYFFLYYIPLFKWISWYTQRIHVGLHVKYDYLLSLGEHMKWKLCHIWIIIIITRIMILIKIMMLKMVISIMNTIMTVTLNNCSVRNAKLL